MKKMLILLAIFSLTNIQKTKTFDINQHGPYAYIAAFLSYGFYHFCIKDQKTKPHADQKAKKFSSIRNIEAGNRFCEIQEQKK